MKLSILSIIADLRLRSVWPDKLLRSGVLTSDITVDAYSFKSTCAISSIACPRKKAWSNRRNFSEESIAKIFVEEPHATHHPTTEDVAEVVLTAKLWRSLHAARLFAASAPATVRMV